MALAEKLHHTSRGQKIAGAGEEESEKKYTAKFRVTPPPPAFFQLYDEEDAVWGGRPAALLEPRPQDRVERHHGEHIGEICPFVPILDVPEPQLGAPVVEFMHAIDTAKPEQVIEVPRLSPDRIPQRSLDRRPQSAEQLVEVPTQPWYVAFVLASKVVSRRELRQILAGLQEGGRRARGGLQGSRAGQNSTASGSRVVDNPVPLVRREGGGSIQGSLPVQNSAAVMEQFVDIPARRAPD